MKVYNVTYKLNTDQLVEEVLVAMENIPQEEGEDSNYLRGDYWSW